MGILGDDLPDCPDESVELVAVSPRVWKRMVRFFHMFNNFGVSGDLTMKSGQDFVKIIHSEINKNLTCTITGNATTSGEYTGWIISGQLAGNITGQTASNFTAGTIYDGNVNDSDFGNMSGKCIIVNLGEADSNGWALQKGTAVQGYLIGYSTDGNTTPIIASSLAPTALIPVTLTMDGGVPGGNTSAGNFTYTVNNNAITSRAVKYGNGSTITGLSPQWARPVGNMTAAGHGNIFFTGPNTCTLWNCDEIDITGPCT